MFKKPTPVDWLIAAVFIALITFQPYFLHGKINLFELGIYLPNIDAIFNGKIPYRDFFYLRGPFELYMPAFLMMLWGKSLIVLETYFYLGNVLALVMCAWIAKELYAKRIFFYLLVPVLVARAFPRVVFMYWGGMRYVLGLAVVLCLVKFVRTRRAAWSFAAGILGALSLMTSVEIGVCAVFAAACVFSLSYFSPPAIDRRILRKGIWNFCVGLGLVVGAFGVYMLQTHSLVPFLESVYAVVFKSHPTFATQLTSTSPRTLPQFLGAMMPWDKNFKYLTPMYLYLFVAVYLVMKWYGRKLDAVDLGITAVTGYGFILYLAAFRIIEGGQFETALQVEKILLFLLSERVYSYLGSLSPAARNMLQRRAAGAFLGVLIVSSVGYSLQRYSHRFPLFHLAGALFSGKGIDAAKPMKDEPSRALTIARAKGIVVPLEQAEELEAVTDFFRDKTISSDVVFTYPDLGIYSFLIERPYLGRFPVAFFTWMNDAWHRELMEQLKGPKPRYAILTREPNKDFADVYFTSGHNREYYQEVVDFIKMAYSLDSRTPKSDIYRLNVP